MNQLFTIRSFRLAQVALGLICIALVFSITSFGYSWFIGILLVISVLFSFAGITQLIRGRKENKNYKFIVALIINVGVIGLFLWVIILNLIDILTYFDI